MKKILSGILATIITIFCVGCEDSPVAKQQMFDPNGVWKCKYIMYSTTECMIGDWTEKYKETHEYPEYMFFPTHIGDVKVVQIGIQNWGKDYYRGEGKRFVPYTVRFIIAHHNTSKTALMISTDKLESIAAGNKYVPSLYLTTYQARFPKRSFYIANVVYDINYENEEYKYHCVDNYDYSDEENLSYITIIPPDPEREGYEFDGWYKDPDCINKWDYEKDTLPQIKYDEEGEVLFQETALYAKWNKL